MIRRLPRYYRFLGDLLKAGFTRISSKELSQKMGLTASQIRQDLNCFGGFGQQGYGYNVAQLRTEVANILGTDDRFPAILVGVGNIGRAIAVNMDFENMGFALEAMFDSNPQIIGTQVNGRAVMDVTELERFCLSRHPLIAVLTLPRSAAPLVVDQLVSYGIAGFWNFSHYDFSVKYPQVVVENVHLGDSLMTLSYMVKSVEEKRAKAKPAAQ